MKARGEEGAARAVDLTADQATNLSAAAGLAESLDRLLAADLSDLGTARWMAGRLRELLAELRGPEEERRRRVKMVCFVDKVRADAELAGVVCLAMQQHVAETSGDFDAGAILGQLRRLSGRLEKRSDQAERLNVA